MKKYRIEVGRSKSPAWPWFLRFAKRFPTYKVLNEDGLELHVIETDNMGDLSAIYEMIRSWRGWAFYMDGRPVSRGDLARMNISWQFERSRDPLAKYNPPPWRSEPQENE